MPVHPLVPALKKLGRATKQGQQCRSTIVFAQSNEFGSGLQVRLKRQANGRRFSPLTDQIAGTVRPRYAAALTRMVETGTLMARRPAPGHAGAIRS